MVSEGHTVGNHTMTHPDMSGISSKDDFLKQLNGVEELYESVTGEKMSKFYRLRESTVPQTWPWPKNWDIPPFSGALHM